MSTALITGASRGIGTAIAIEFAKHNIDLVLNCNKSVDKLTELARKLQDTYNIKTQCMICDVGNYDSFVTAYNNLNLSAFSSPHIDILINNAGIAHLGLLQDMTSNEWDRLINTNVKSIFNTTKNIIPDMIARQSGRIINISSVWGEVGASYEVAYSASKGAVNSFTKALAKELAPSGIAVNAISCGYIETEMNNHLNNEEKEELFNEIPAGRPGDVNEIAAMCYSLSLAPKYLTGQIIRVDGAWI